ncbi:MAG: sigma-54 interaction domain-containing protein [Desulfovermiculus sp.]
MPVHSPYVAQNFDFSSIDFLEPLLSLNTGVIITDVSGRIVLYNEAQSRMDHLEPSEVLSRPITEVYTLSENQSLILCCIRNSQPIIEQSSSCHPLHATDFYQGTYSVFPLRSGGQITGAICFAQHGLVTRKRPQDTLPKDEKNSSFSKNSTRFTFSDLIGTSPEFLACIHRARAASITSSTVMICGETGTGKEMLAQSIHNESPRRHYPFIAVNCAAIPESLQESTIFGTTRGAFTGAMEKRGLFEAAQGGTLYLDEVDSMSPSLQAKLLRVLQDMKIRRLGSNTEKFINLRIISSVKKDYRQPLPLHTLRKDLYYRLSVVYLEIPPLRVRPKDLDLLTTHFINRNNIALGLRVESISPQVMELFSSYTWPGNVRELEHVLEGAMNAVGKERVLRLEHIPANFAIEEKSSSEAQTGNNFYTFFPIKDQDKLLKGLDRLKSGNSETEFQGDISLTRAQNRNEAELLYKVIKAAEGNISMAARHLGISRQLLHYKLKKFGITPKKFKKY